MSTRKIEIKEWQRYFDRLSKTLSSSVAKMEVLDSDLGDQTAFDWKPISGISYDPRDQELDVILDELDHRILRPAQIFVQEEGNEVSSIEVIDARNQKQILSLKAA
jgi:hypothetical protein